MTSVTMDSSLTKLVVVLTVLTPLAFSGPFREVQLHPRPSQDPSERYSYAPVLHRPLQRGTVTPSLDPSERYSYAFSGPLRVAQLRPWPSQDLSERYSYVSGLLGKEEQER